MSYKKGTIIFARRTIFADNGQYDLTGHPGLIPVAIDDYTDEMYYLLLTSNVSRILAFPNQYYDLSNCWERVNLKKPSLINLRYIYKEHASGKKIGGLDPRTYKDVIRKLKIYQNEHPCEYYEEIKDRL